MFQLLSYIPRARFEVIVPTIFAFAAVSLVFVAGRTLAKLNSK